MTPTNRYLTTLTPLRGIAALLVLIFHSNLMAFPFVPPGYTNLVSGGWIWVDFFFILSGFILFYVYGRDFHTGVVKGAYWKYIGARFARVYPLHFVTLIWCSIAAAIVHLLATGLDPFLAPIFDLKSIPASLVMLQSMHLYDMTPLNTPSWSLSTEWWMYMLFPFVVPVLLRLSSPGKILVFMLVAALYVIIRYVISPNVMPMEGMSPTINLTYDFGFLRCLAGFSLGMLLYVVYESQLGIAILKRDVTFVIIFLLILTGLHFGVDEFVILSLFPFLIICGCFNNGHVKQFLDTRPLQRLGDWSFSIYMVHVPIIFILWVIQVRKNPAVFADFMKMVQAPPDYTTGAIVCIFLVITTLIIASVTYRYIEVPAREYLNRRFSKPKNKASVALETETSQ
jgi:peptidoglycan/LPS O-acetylase OafA/YrhL